MICFYYGDVGRCVIIVLVLFITVELLLLCICALLREEILGDRHVTTTA